MLSAYQPRRDIKLQRIECSGFEPFDGDGAHCGIVGAIFQFRDVKFNAVDFTSFLELGSEQLVSRDTTADTQRFQSSLL